MKLKIKNQPPPFRELEQVFPEKLYVIFQSTSGAHVCLTRQELTGLICFTGGIDALNFMDSIPIGNLAVRRVTFDEACACARSNKSTATCLFLADNLHEPEVFHVC